MDPAKPNEGEPAAQIRRLAKLAEPALFKGFSGFNIAPADSQAAA
jgi:hypothetical protein